MSTSKANNEIIFSSESSLFSDHDVRKNFDVQVAIPNNQIV